MGVILNSGRVLSQPTAVLFSRAVNSFPEEIKCYSLPYGALGFISHLLTYWTLACLWSGVRPLWPSRKASYTWFDFIVGFISLITTAAMPIVTLVKCRNTWQLLAIGVWEFSMSLLNGLTMLHVASNVGKQTPGWWMTWFLLYLPGLFTGFAGLMSLVAHHIHHHKGVMKITIAFYIIVGLLTYLGIVDGDDPQRRNSGAHEEQNEANTIPHEETRVE